METDGKMRLDGAVVFWHLSKYTNRYVLNHNLQQLGISQMEQRTAMSVLQDAIEDVHGTDSKILVRPLKRGKQRGYCVVREDRGDTENDYENCCSYTIEDDEKILSYDGTEQARLADVTFKFSYLRNTLKNQQVSAMLLVNLRKMGGIRLNPNGFAYWVPQDSLPAWRDLSEAVSAASLKENNFYVISHQFDEAGLVAVKDALIRDVTAEIEEINADVESGKLRHRALTARSDQAQALKAKVERYETLLGETLEAVKGQVGEVYFAAAQAALLQSVALEEKRLAKVKAELKELGVDVGSEGD